VFYRGVQLHLLFYLDYHICAKMATSSIRKTEKGCRGPSQVSRVGGGGGGGYDRHVVFCPKFSGGKGSVRWCIVVMQQPVLMLPKLGVKFSHVFTLLP
jgi:hypothetical protein